MPTCAPCSARSRVKLGLDSPQKSTLARAGHRGSLPNLTPAEHSNNPGGARAGRSECPAGSLPPQQQGEQRGASWREAPRGRATNPLKHRRRQPAPPLARPAAWSLSRPARAARGRSRSCPTTHRMRGRSPTARRVGLAWITPHRSRRAAATPRVAHTVGGCRSRSRPAPATMRGSRWAPQPGRTAAPCPRRVAGHPRRCTRCRSRR
mmetsp:Transcript_95139/g.238537  ORF Transcript_95139/g.238537 Transcript_95139/m.238537 type:complete len:207 (-) Transcript_95139:1635-2255(-)